MYMVWLLIGLSLLILLAVKETIILTSFGFSGLIVFVFSLFSFSVQTEIILFICIGLLILGLSTYINNKK